VASGSSHFTKNEPMPSQKPPAGPCTEDGTPLLKMKELVEATGVAKSTILLYVNKGLLPQPRRTGPNMAYYQPAMVERVALIKQLQSSHRLPLAAIKGLLRAMDDGKDIASLLKLQAFLFSSPDGKKMDGIAFSEATGLTPEQIDHLVNGGLIIPLEDGSFDHEDAAVARSLAKALARGIDPADLAFYPRLGREIVDNELRVRKKYTEDLEFEQDAALTLVMTQVVRGLRAYIIDRIMQRQLIAYKGLKNSKRSQGITRGVTALPDT
jgi:DNA-binding transcriptional MerR regulator